MTAFNYNRTAISSLCFIRRVFNIVFAVIVAELIYLILVTDCSAVTVHDRFMDLELPTDVVNVRADSVFDILGG